MLAFRDPLPSIYPYQGSQFTSPQDNIPTLGGGEPLQRCGPTSPYYSIVRHNRQWKRESGSQSTYGADGSYSRAFRFDTATAYAVKSAQYPVIYERLKAPRAARKALSSWKKDRKLPALEETDGARALEGRTRELIEDIQREHEDDNPSVVEEGTTTHNFSDNVELQHLAEHGCPQERIPSNGGAASITNSDGGISRPSISPANAVIVRRTTPTNDFPPQHMTFSEPVLERTKRGRRLRITCTLGQTYPNFHIECDYIHVDKMETTNSSRVDTRFSFASILTRENIWVIALEQTGYNEAFIKGALGETEYARLESGVSGPIKGHPRSTRVAAMVAKKINVPGEYNLGGIWCKAASFYKMIILIPEKDYRGKE